MKRKFYSLKFGRREQGEGEKKTGKFDMVSLSCDPRDMLE